MSSAVDSASLRRGSASAYWPWPDEHEAEAVQQHGHIRVLVAEGLAADPCRLEVRSIKRLVDLILTARKDIRHPNPRIAVSLGLVMVAATLYDIVVMPVTVEDWKELLPKDDQALKRELTRAFLSYLGADTQPRGQSAGSP